ncbi:MAG TPA: hypothetical protein VK477_07505 [Acidobacteriota bacterium]|nr:hypothetical protein [Acidobacteriota bacterium]
MLSPSRLVLVVGVVCATTLAQAWDAEGHRIVNQLALHSLPADFPEFARAAAATDRILHLANVPDRWRNVDPALKQTGGSWTDHFLDVEQIPDAGLDVQKVPSRRLDFALMFAAGRLAHAEKFSAIDPAKNPGHTDEWPGFAPWAITDNFHRLRSAFGYLKAYREVGGTPSEIANSEADVIYAMGLLGHSVADCAQPLHTTVHHNGWTGENPNGYTKWPRFHSWIDGGFVAKAGLKVADLQARVTVAEPIPMPQRADGRDPLFVVVMDYLLATHTKVETVYQMEKAGLLANRQELPVTPEGRAFFEERFLAGGHMLARLWVTAWKSAPLDTYLRETLVRRQTKAAAEANPPADKSATP